MKRRQKKLGNKGFSLVELIVVIAIMAVLVGVLAPTLIKNVEKSKESTDLQNLDTIRGAVTTALSDEAVYNEVGSGTIIISFGEGSTADVASATINNTAIQGSSAYDNLADELEETLTSSIKMKSSVGKSGYVLVKIVNGKVTAGIYSTTDGSTDALTCKRVVDAAGDVASLESK